MHTLLMTALLSAALSLGVALSGCRSAPTPEASEASAAPEAPRSSAALKAPDDAPLQIQIERAGEGPPLGVDAEIEEWDQIERALIEERSQVLEGARAWRGARDASMRVGARSDQRYLYLLIEVSDDRVLEGGQDVVRLWLRDPRLAELNASLPPGTGLDLEGSVEVALDLFPDGSISAVQGTSEARIEESVIAARAETKQGWRVELALAPELFPALSRLPIAELELYVELYDGDEERSKTYQSVLASAAGEIDDAPRYLPLPLDEKVRPHDLATSLGDPATRLGVWRHEKASWSFQALDQRSKLWRKVNQPNEALQGATGEFGCSSRDRDRQVLHAYQSESGTHRVMLLSCSTPADERGRCEEEVASTQIIWVHMMRKAGQQSGYEVKSHLELFEEPLKQCGAVVPERQIVHDQFALAPLDAAHDSLWAFGWSERTRDEKEEYAFERRAMRIIDARRASASSAYEVIRREDQGLVRHEIRQTSYLLEVDEVAGLDVCRIDIEQEQFCDAFQRRCAPHERGQTVGAYVELWDPEQRRLKRYLPSKHKGCPTRLDFAEREGYLLYYDGAQIALIPSPA